MKAWWERRSLAAKLAFCNGLTAASLWAVLLLLVRASAALVMGGLAAALLMGVVSYLFGRRILAAVSAMAERLRHAPGKQFGQPVPVKNRHDELGRLALDVNETLRMLADAFAQLDRLTADVSHELRTPLTAMRAVGEVALRDSNPAVLHDAVGSMLEEVRRMNQLIERLLLLTRPGEDEMPVKLEAGLLRPVLLEVSDSLGLVAEEKQQRLEVDCPEHLLAVFDPELLRLALINLVQNAIRYSPCGKPIRTRAVTTDGMIAIEVIDEGPGIAPEHQEKVFERFYRVDKARSRSAGGVGLGLAIVKWAVERMNGTVELKSEFGRGSVFILRLRSIQT